MISSIGKIMGLRVDGRDGKQGQLADVLFGDRSWAIRYFCVARSRPHRLNLHYLSDERKIEVGKSRVLVRPEQFESLEEAGKLKSLEVKLDREQLKACPGLFENLPVEDEYDREYHRYFRHGIYDDRPEVPQGTDERVIGYRPPVSAYDHDTGELREHVQRIKEIGSHHLHSAVQVMDYDVVNREGKIGELDDLIVDLGEWRLTHLVFRSGKLLAARRYLLPIAEVERLDWSRAAFQVKLDDSQIEGLRQYAPGETLESR